MARKSIWLVSAQADDPNIKPCTKCKGTGGKAGGGSCPACRGFGY